MNPQHIDLSVKVNNKNYSRETDFGPYYEVPGGWDYVVEPYVRPTITASTYGKIKDYKLMSVISTSETSVVYNAFDSINNQYVAIKEIFNWLSFEKEKQAYRRVCNHPCVPEIYDTFTLGYTGYIVMELLDGNLLSISDSMNIYDIKFIVKQILYTLNYFDKAGLIYFDLKPKNICYIIKKKMVQVKLIDFHMSEIDSTVKDKNFQAYYRKNPYSKQSLYYRSYLDDTAGPHVDIWSLGCIMYEMIHKRILFEDISEENAPLKNKQIITDMMYKNGIMMVKDKQLTDFIFHLLSRPPALIVLRHPWLSYGPDD